jgi:hypothetical protein
MTLERLIRIIAGTFILLSLALGHYLSPYWYLFTAFVGLNLFQSGFTNWCPMMTVLRKLGVGEVKMPDWAWGVAFVVAYLVLTQWLLPKLGVPT